MYSNQSKHCVALENPDSSQNRVWMGKSCPKSRITFLQSEAVTDYM